MKICQLCAVDFTMYHFLLPLMRGMADAGHEVVGISADGPLLGAVRDAGFRVEAVPISRSYSLSSHWRTYRLLRQLFRQEKFDMLHAHTPVASLVGRLAAWRAGVPRVVYTAHGFYFHDRMPAVKRSAFVLLEWLAGQVTDVLFTQAVEDAATARRLGLCRGGTVEAIGNGSNPERFRPDPVARESVRQALGTGDDTVVIVMVGRLVAEKGYPELFEAMRRVDGELWVIGERLQSDHAAAIDDAIDTARNDPELSRRIRFLGYRDDVPDLLKAADIFTLPSHREGMPRSIIEAMLSGLPVVATDIRGSREEVLPEETGLLVPVADGAALAAALGRLAGDAAERRRMGDAGCDRAVDLYDEAKVVARQIELLGL